MLHNLCKKSFWLSHSTGQTLCLAPLTCVTSSSKNAPIGCLCLLTGHTVALGQRVRQSLNMCNLLLFGLRVEIVEGHFTPFPAMFSSDIICCVYEEDFDHRNTLTQRWAFINGYRHVIFWTYKESHWETSICYLKTGSDDFLGLNLIHEEHAVLWVIWPIWFRPELARPEHRASFYFSCGKKKERSICGGVCLPHVCTFAGFSCATARKVKLSRVIGGGLWECLVMR